MGAAQSIPVVGEAVTAIDSGVKLVAAGFCATVGAILDDEGAKSDAKQFVNDAGKTWVEYSERSVIAAPIRAAVHAIDDNKEAKRVLKKMGKSVEKVVDNIPIVGHTKGVVHYIAGDKEHGDECMKGANRTTAVLGAGALTGGLGGGLLLGGAVGVSSGVAYDGTVTLIESEVKKEDCPYGLFASIEQVRKSNEAKDGHGVISSVIDIGYTLTGDFVGGIDGAKLGKSLSKGIKASKQKTALKQKVGKKGAEDIIDTAKKLKSKTKRGAGDGHVCTKAKKLDTGEIKYGYNRRLRRQMRSDEFAKKGRASGYKSKTNAMKGHVDEFSRESGLLEDVADQTGVKVTPIKGRVPRACAEHHAINKLGTHGGESNIQTCSVMQKDGSIFAVERCDNCKQYGSLMGEVITDRVHGMAVPTKELAVGAAVLAGIEVVGEACIVNAKGFQDKPKEEEDENNEEEEGKKEK